MAGRAKILATPVGFPHSLAVDSNGTLWSTWTQLASENRLIPPKFLSYNPERDESTYHLFGPFDESVRFNPPASLPAVDTMFTSDDGYIYIGAVDGNLYRLDPEAGNCQWLGKPSPAMRIAGLAEGPDGLLYGTSGMGSGNARTLSELWSYDRKKNSFRRLGPLIDTEKNIFCDYPHGLSINGKGDTLYVAETDTPRRASALWECRL